MKDDSFCLGACEGSSAASWGAGSGGMRKRGVEGEVEG